MSTPGRRLHVLLVAPGFPPERGGVEEHVGRLAAELVALGARVTVLAARRGIRRTLEEDHGGVRVVLVPAWRTTAMSIAPRLLVRALAVGHVDVLHVHSYHALAGLAALNPRMRGRVVLTPHFHGDGHTPLARVLHRVYGRVGARVVGAAAAVICVSEAEQRLLTATFPAAGATSRVIPNGVAVDTLQAAAPWPDEPPTVLSVGRLEPYKHVGDVVDAMSQIPAPAQLVVIGGGSQQSALVEQAASQGLSGRVRVLGPVETDDLHRWLRTARVLVSTSEHEAFGMAPLEAAAAGAAVVLSDIPAHREIAGRYLGAAATVVDVTDPAVLAAAVRSGLADRPGAVVEIPSWADVARQTLATYEQVLGRSAGTVVDPDRPRGRTSAKGRRIGLLDRSWFGHWSVAAVGPVQVPSVDRLRAILLRYLEENPGTPLACTVDPVRSAWVPVPEADRRAHVARLVQPGEPLDLDAIPDYVERHRPPVSSDLVFSCVLSSCSMVVYVSHLYGDAATFTDVVLGLVQGDADALEAIEPRSTLPVVVQALSRQTRSTYGGWLRRGLRSSPPARAAQASVEAPRGLAPSSARLLTALDGPHPVWAGVVLSNADLRAITRWRNANARGASITAVLASRAYAGLVAEGVPVRGDAFYSLFDLRSLLRSRRPKAQGNLGKSLLIEADLSDARAVDAALRATIESRRALPAMVSGALTAGLGRRRRESPPSTEAVMTFNSMPSLPGLEAMPWTGTGPRRYFGMGYPSGPAGISVFAVRFRDRMELTAGLDVALADEATVTRALSRVRVTWPDLPAPDGGSRVPGAPDRTHR